MEYEAGSYRKILVKQYPARSLRETAEGKYWKRFAAPSVAKQVRRNANKLPRPWRQQPGAATDGGTCERQRRPRRRPPPRAALAPAAANLLTAPPTGPHQIGGVTHIDFCPQAPYN